MSARPGSQLAAEQKEDKRILIGVTIATVLIALCLFVFPTQLREHMRNASTFANVTGFILIVASLVWVWYGAANFLNAKGAVVWLILLALGICLSCGFNFGDYGTSQQPKIDNGGNKTAPAEDLIKQ